MSFRRRGLFGIRDSTLISQAIPRQIPGFLALSKNSRAVKVGERTITTKVLKINPDRDGGVLLMKLCETANEETWW
ncbi:MAG: hypothetical protein JNM66_24165 [Bryobacterales bacterium]|nr:hypothetical protein [Bryobacterales bacterium]